MCDRKLRGFPVVGQSGILDHPEITRFGQLVLPHLDLIANNSSYGDSFPVRERIAGLSEFLGGEIDLDLGRPACNYRSDDDSTNQVRREGTMDEFRPEQFTLVFLGLCKRPAAESPGRLLDE